MARNFSGDPGAYIPVDYDYLKSLDQEQFKQALTEIFTNLANAINVREAGYYYLTQDNQPFTTGAVYFPTDTSSASSNTFGRQVVRKIVNFGALPNATTKSVAHGITFRNSTTKEDYTLYGTMIYGCATKPNSASDPTPNNAKMVPLPNQDIQVSLDATNITVDTTTVDYSSFTTCYMVIEYLLS